MFNTLWEQIFTALGSALLLFLPWALGRYRDRRNREKEMRFWQDTARELLDLAGSYRALLGRYLAQESSPDGHIKLKFDEYELDYDRLTNDYKRGPNGNDVKK